MADLDRLIERFAASFEAGEEPDPRELLEQVEGAERQELASRLDRYLMEAPRRRWDPEAYEDSPAKEAVERVYGSLAGVSGTWPELLPHLRHKARLKRSELVKRLAERLGVASGERKVAAYYHEMEQGMLPSEGVSQRVIDALAELVGASAEAVRAAGERRGASGAASPGEPAGTFARVAEPDPEYLSDADAGGERRAEAEGELELDEVDRLFTGG